MRNLTLNEMNVVSGSGIDTKGYNFTFIVSNALTMGFIGFFFGVAPLHCAGLGAAYGAAMLTAQVADNYFFDDSRITKPVTPITTITPATAEPVQVAA